MDYCVQPSVVGKATVTVPGDKSISHRALMLGSLATGRSDISGFLAGEDCLATLAAFRAMGVRIDQHDETSLTVHGVGLRGLAPPAGTLDLGNSGTAMRLMTGVLCAQSFDTTLSGDASLLMRPMGRVIAPLERMGARIESDAGKPPLEIRGGRSLTGIAYALPVASAQVKSAVLLAGLYASGRTEVIEPQITRDHTERMLAAMGADLETVPGRIGMEGGQALIGTRIEVPADLSSAAFVMLAALLADNADVTIVNVGINPTRAGVIDILKAMGADISIDNIQDRGREPVADIRVRSSKLHGCAVDPALVSLAIDEFPALFVAAAAATGTTTFTGIAELRVKESDRIAAMAAGLRALGISVEESDDGAVVHGGQFAGAVVDSCKDHRIAMALAVAGSVAHGPVRIRDVDNVETSFPGFARLMGSLGISIHEEQGNTTIPVIAIDGPSGSGKGTIARRVAEALGYHLLDSGALYRLTALAAERRGTSLDDTEQLSEIARTLDVEFGNDEHGNERVLLEGEDVTIAIRSEAAGTGASQVAALQPVREALLKLQRGFRKAPGLVADGRDMGTHVFVDAGLKVFLTASAEERATRRHKQLKDKGIDVSLAALSRDIEARDRRDTNRTVAPLRPATDARVLDSSGQSIEAVTSAVLAWAEKARKFE